MIKRMIKVRLKPFVGDARLYMQGPVHREMKQWCRDHCGKNPVKGSKIWGTNYSYAFREKTYTFSFFFADPKHAQWFSLRWL